MKRYWQLEELIEHFTLLPEEYAILPDRRAHTRLGFAVLLKWYFTYVPLEENVSVNMTHNELLVFF